MGLELVGSQQNRERADTAAGGDISRALGRVMAEVADAQQQLSAVRERLQILLEQAAELRRRLNVGSPSSGNVGMPGG